MTALLTAPTASSWSEDQWAAWRSDVRRLGDDGRLHTRTQPVRLPQSAVGVA